MANDKKLRINSLLLKLSAEFISNNANKMPMITVTKVNTSSDGKRADILVSVYPDTKEKETLSFLNRKEKDARSYIAKRSKLKVLPKLHFSIDYGEKNRQKIDSILKEI